MKRHSNSKKTMKKPKGGGITAIIVCGYKSICQERRIEIRPLTILAGANSSGKSSAIQPILLLKQTLDASYDPGPLLLNGPNVKFTSVEQLLSRTSQSACPDIFSIGIEVEHDKTLTIYFQKDKKGFEIQQMVYTTGEKTDNFRMTMTNDEIIRILPRHLKDLSELISKSEKTKLEWSIIRERCFLGLDLRRKGEKKTFLTPFPMSPSTIVEPHIRKLIHLPALRGNPERTYHTTSVGSAFPGTFEKYVASIIANWKAGKNDGKLKNLGKDLEKLGLTWKVVAEPINDTQVELRVGRLPMASRGGAYDLVSIADVGFGVSQALPVIIALQIAQKGQIVYLEQPEIHLHPRAQYSLAELLANAAKRGVKVIVETHSSLLLRGVQTQVAEGALAQNLVKLHWFIRDPIDGITEVSSGDLDGKGAFGDWPEDFDIVELQAESKYLDAVESGRKR